MVDSSMHATVPHPPSRARRGRIRAARAAFALTLVLAAGCVGRRPPSDCAPPLGTVTFPGGKSICVEVAQSPEMRARGYMFREKVGRDEGMVFLMETTDLHPFWMKNCKTSLDIIWMDEEWRVVHIAASVPPCMADPCPSYGTMSKSRYILEVGAGESGYLGIYPGMTLRFEPPSGEARK